MIKTLLFDFGDVFINLDKKAPNIEMKKIGIHSFSNEMIETNKQYETGKIATTQFLDWYHKAFPCSSKKQLSDAWNSIILTFPEYRLKFLEGLANSKQYQLILLSNTNNLHIEKVIENMTLKRKVSRLLVTVFLKLIKFIKLLYIEKWDCQNQV